jgi:hypothetical protein
MRRVIVDNNQSPETIDKVRSGCLIRMQVLQSPELTPLAGPDNLLLQIEHIRGRLQHNYGWLKLRRSVCLDKDQRRGD